MKYFFILIFFIITIIANTIKSQYFFKNNDEKYLVIEKLKVKNNNHKYKVYIKVFDYQKRIILYREGNLNTTDSIVYKYSNDIVESFEYKPDENRKLILSNTEKEIYKTNILGKKIIYKDTFNLYDDINFKEIERLYNDKLSISKKIVNSVLIYKYHYHTKGDKIFMLLPYVSNNSGTELAEGLDSLNIYSDGNKILREAYFFKKKVVSKEYYYNLNRLIKIKNEVVSPDYKDSFFEEFNYKYINSISELN